MDLFFTAVISLGSMLALGIFVCWLIDKFRERANPEYREKARQAYEAERALLSTPNFKALEDHFGNVPAELRSFYENQDLIKRTGFYFVSGSNPEDYDYIDTVLPAHLTSLDHAWFPMDPNYFPFATDGGGNLYVVDMSQESHCSVYFVDHEVPNEPVRLSDSFLKWSARPTCKPAEI